MHNATRGGIPTLTKTLQKTIGPIGSDWQYDNLEHPKGPIQRNVSALTLNPEHLTPMRFRSKHKVLRR